MGEELTLEELMERRLGKKGILSASLELYREWVEGKIELEDPSPPETFTEFLGRMDYSSWFWTTVALVSLTVTVVTLVGEGSPLMPLRYILGTLFVLFMPGYTLVEALYPRKEDLSPLERVALSIGLSLALVPLVGLLLNYKPFGIRLYPILISLSALSVALAMVGSYRKYLFYVKKGLDEV